MKNLISLAITLSILITHSTISFAITERDFYNYELKVGRKVVYRGQTNDLKRRALEHVRDGKEFTHLVKIGNAKTREGSLKAEKKSLETYRRSHNGQNPKYNKTNHG